MSTLLCIYLYFRTREKESENAREKEREIHSFKQHTSVGIAGEKHLHTLCHHFFLTSFRPSREESSARVIEREIEAETRARKHERASGTARERDRQKCEWRMGCRERE